MWENEQYLYRFLPLVHNHVQVKWVRTHIRCVTCVCARSGSRLTEGVSEAWCWGNCHRSCRFWTVYSRIMMTYFKQTRLLSSLYLYTSAPCIRFIHLEPGTVYWDMTPTRKKKKESYYDVNNALTQIHFNGTHFLNARLTQRVFSVWPVAQPVVGEMEMHSVANLATLQTPLATFFPSKKRPNLVSENHRYCARARGSCSPSTRTHSLSLSPLSPLISLSLSLCVCSVSVQRAAERSSALIQLNTDIMLLL